MNRRHLLFIWLVCVFIVCFQVGRASAAEGTWDLAEHGVVQLKNGSGEVQQEWTLREWQAQRHLMEATRECVDDAYADCTKAILDHETGLSQPVTKGEAESAENIVKESRNFGDELPNEVTRELDIPSEAGGVLDIGAAGTVLGAITLGPLAFHLGVDIGNLITGEEIEPLDQIFGIPEKNEEKVEAPNPDPEHCTVEHRGPFEINDTSSGGEKKNFPEGYYGNCHVNGGGVRTVFKAKAVTGCEDNRTITEGENLGLGHLIKIVVTNEPGFNESCKEPQEFKRENEYEYWLAVEPATSCAPGAEFIGWLEGEGGINCKPLGIPAPNELTPEIKKNNSEHVHTEVPTSTPPHFPGRGKVEVIPETIKKKALQILPARKFIKEKQTVTVKKMGEEEEENVIEIPLVEKLEVYTHYEERLKELGFTDVKTEILPETAIDVEVGPEDVTRVVPAPGTFVKPATEIVVEVNPSDAPTPGEGSEGIPPPTTPGIKFPSFPVLCKGFPFGVPCWLIKTIENWTATAVCPQWGIENLEIDGKNITGKFDLCKLEPIMSKVRPAMLLFAGIGALLLFFNFAKGSGTPSGSQGDGYFGGQELSSENDTTLWERYGDGS